MSRIQNILDKAERDGSLHRVRQSTIDPGTAPIAPPPPAGPPKVLRDVGASAEPDLGDIEPIAAPHRIISGAPLDRTLVAALDQSSAAAEQYRGLRTRVLNAETGGAVHLLLVTSPGRDEGKSVTAANLALTMGQEFQRRICLVDANLRAPRLHRMFSIPDAPGLADVIAGRATLDEALVTVEDHNVTVLTAGAQAAHPAELVGSTAMRRLLDTLRSQFDRVVIDAPAAVPLADIGILSPLVDGVLLVVRSGLTSKPAVHNAIAAVGSGRLVGLMLNEALPQ